MKLIPNKKVIIIFLVMSYVFATAQNKNNHGEKQALFIYNFSKYIKWPNFDTLKTFKIGVIGDTNSYVYDELVKMAKEKKVWGKPIKIYRIKDEKNIKKLQILYFDNPKKTQINSLYKNIEESPVLLVAKGYPFGYSMINFVIDGDVIKFELNEEECKHVGLEVNIVLKTIAIKSEREWVTLIDKIEHLTSTDKKTVQIDTKDLSQLVANQKKLIKEIEINTKKLKEKKAALKAKIAEINEKELLIKKSEQEIKQQKELISNQLQKINSQKENLANLSANINAKQKELIEQEKQLKIEEDNLQQIKNEYVETEKLLKEKELLVKHHEIKIKNQGNEIVTKTSEIEAQKTTIFLSVIFIFIISFLGLLAYRSYRLKNKANKVILQQKEEIEVQNKEIRDSITYAKRIQDAILPPLKLVRDYMPNSFIFYKPKDIVAGDFYWMESVQDTIIFAAADCTGHGVPGAMVSVVCNNAMNRSVREFELTEPDKILNKTRELVVETFEKSDTDVNDGMDIALCSLNINTLMLSFAGANNGLYYIRNNELNEIKPDKQPIGKYDNAKPFTSHQIQLQKGDVIYTFSDGFPDQFGGAKGKKFMYKPFKRMLMEIHKKPMNEQHKVIGETLTSWKGDLEQIDDICIIGVTI